MRLNPMRRPIGSQNLASLEDVFQSQLENLQISQKKRIEEKEEKPGFHCFTESKSLTIFTFVLSYLSPEKTRKLDNGGGTFSFQILENI